MTRYAQVDGLRGFALMGILGVNTFSIAYGMQSLHGGHLFNGQALSEQAIVFLVAAFIEGKFYPIFAFLFGASFALMAASMQRQGFGAEEVRSRMKRRMVWLLAAGVLHGSLLFFGDILFTYAMAGLFLVGTLAHRASDHIRSLVKAAIYLAVLMAIGIGFSFFMNERDMLLEGYQDSQQMVRVLADGSWADVARRRIKDFWTNQFGAFVALPLIYGYFMVGRLAVRQGWLTRAHRYARQWRMVLWTGLALGVPLNLLHGAATLQAALDPLERAGWQNVSDWLFNFASPLLAAAYVAAFVLFCQRPPKGMQAMGRMALTNYLAQSAIGMVLLGPHLSRPALLCYAVAMVALQWWWSQAWLAQHRQGPLEAIWRRYTHGDGKIEG